MNTRALLFALIVMLAASPAFGTGTTEETAPAIEGSTEEPVDLTYYMLLPPQTEQDAVFQAANELISEEINATVDFRNFGWGSYFETVNVRLSAGDPFDLLWNCNWQPSIAHHIRAREGDWMELDELFPEYAPETYAFLSQFAGGHYLDFFRIDGHIYGVPNFQQIGQQKGIWFRKDLVEKYGFDVNSVEDYRDIEPFLEIVKQNEPTVTPLLIDQNGFASILPFNGAEEPTTVVGGIGYVNWDEPLTVKNWFYDPYNIEAYNTTFEWAQAGYFDPDTAITVQRSMEAGASGTYAAGILAGYTDTSSAELSAQWGVEVVAIPYGDSYFMGGESTFGTVTSISATSEHPARAMMLIEMLNTRPELYNLLVYGIQGTHYTMNDAGLVIQKPESGYNNIQLGWAIGNTTQQYLTPQMPADRNEKIIEKSRNVTPMLYGNFLFDQRPVQDEADAFDPYYQEFIRPLNVGLVNPAAGETPQDVFEYVSERARDIIDVRFAEVKRQFEEYLVNEGVR